MSRQRWLRACVVGALGGLVITTTGGFAREQRAGRLGPVLTYFPRPVDFGTTVVGEIAYQLVTIQNNGDADDYLSTATATDPFFPTFGGTCNTSLDPLDPTHNYRIPAGGSCTFQWGFNPTHPGKYNGTGTLQFEQSATLPVNFVGRGTKH
jgi:hypothetical protein